VAYLFPFIHSQSRPDRTLWTPHYCDGSGHASCSCASTSIRRVGIKVHSHTREAARCPNVRFSKGTTIAKKKRLTPDHERATSSRQSGKHAILCRHGTKRTRRHVPRWSTCGLPASSLQAHQGASSRELCPRHVAASCRLAIASLSRTDLPQYRVLDFGATPCRHAWSASSICSVDHVGARWGSTEHVR